MHKPDPAVPDKTLETLARNFGREAAKYGFRQIDYLRYINFLLEYANDETEGLTSAREGGEVETIAAPDWSQGLNVAAELPVAGERVRVRSFDAAEDTERLREWLTDDYGRYFLLSRISGRRTDVDAFLANARHRIGVVELHDGQAIGAVAFLNYDTARRKAELRKLIGDRRYRGTGLARESTELWIRHGLSGLGLKKIYVNTLHTHFRNIKLNESLGFRVEGLLHNEALIDGEYHDVLRMGLWWEGNGDSTPCKGEEA